METYYPIGNSRSVDVTHHCQVAKECNILMLGCGDVRNVLHTLHVLSQDGTTDAQDQTLHFHLNDIERGILARDLLLLHIVGTIDPSNTEDLKFLWAVWYDALLSELHSERLKQSVKGLLATELHSYGMYFGNEKSERKIREALQVFTRSGISGKRVKKTRDGFLEVLYNSDKPEFVFDKKTGRMVRPRVDLPHTAVEWISLRVSAHCLRLEESSDLRERYYEEIREHVSTGITRVNSKDDRLYGNITLFRPESDVWVVPDECCPFWCYDVDLQLHRYDGRKVTLSSLCLEIMKTWVESYQAVMKGGCNIKIHLWLGNAIVVCKTDLPEDLQFDFIDTSNIADRVGLILLLLHCQEKLKHPNGVLRTESFFWNQVIFISVEDFLCQCLDIPVSNYPTMIGLHLAEELTLGHEELLPTYENDVRSKLTLRWTAAIAKDTITKLRVLTDGTDAVSKTVYALENHTKLDKIPTTALDLNYTGNKLYRRLMELKDSTASDDYLVVEFTDYYSVIISGTEQDGLENGVFKVGIVDGDPQVIMLECIEKGITVRLHFACSISLNSTRIYSREDGTVECRLIKNSDLIAGERVLPWKKLDVSTVAELADFPQSKYRGSTLKTYTSRMWSTDATCELMPPERQLAHIVEFIFGASSSIKIKSSKPSGKTTNIILQLECLKIFENKPTMFLSYFDSDKAKHLVSQKKMNNEEFQIAYQNFEHACVEMDAQSPREMKEGYELLVKMMEINSYRMTQDQPEDKRWILRTFVRGRYPYTDHFTNTFCRSTSFTQLFATFGMGQKAASRTTSDSGAASSTNLKQLCANCGKTSPDCKKCARCNKVSYCGKACQRKAWSVHKGVCKEEENKHSLPSCANCGRTSPDCKKCARCNKVSYCGKACQKKAWSVHKGVCKEEENEHSLPSCANCGRTSPDCKKCARCNKVSYCGKACQKKAWSVHKGVCKSEGN